MKKLTLVLLMFLFTGCENNQKRIAMATLFPEDAMASQVKLPGQPFPTYAFPALTGALNGKFPAGSDPEALKNYATKLGGACYQKQAGQPLECSFVEYGTLCVQTRVAITAATTSLNKIESIEAKRIFEGC